MNSDNNSGQTGFAVITEMTKGFSVEVETSAPEFQGEAGQAMHIHVGTCGEIGEIKVGLTNLKALSKKMGRAGSTTTVTAMTLNDFSTGEWSINVHDERERSVYVSCGRIPRP